VIQPRWDNFICVNLRRLSDLKLAWQTSHPSPNDSIDTLDASTTLRIKAPKGRQPNFANIVWMAVGVVCDNNSTAAPGYSGELWVDELKVAGIKQLIGWASRLNLQTQLADLLNISAGFDYQGGDFRTMTDTRITMGDSRLSGNLNLSTGLDKFMPKEWGVAMPVGGAITSSLTRPQLKPNTDVYLTDKDNKPDGFLEIMRDVVGARSATQTAAEHFETQTYTQNFFVNYSKSNTSTNPAIDMLLQRLSAQFQYNLSNSHTNRGRLNADSDSNFVDSTSTRTYTGSLNYDLSPRDPPKWTKWKPLADSKSSWLPARWKDLEFSLLPTKVSINLASATYSTNTARTFEPGDTTLKVTRDLTLNHGLQIDYAPIRPFLNFSYGLTINRDFPNNSNLGTMDDAFRFLGSQFFSWDQNSQWKRFDILLNERSRSQQFKMTFNPQTFDWLTNTADYTANYSGALTQLGSDSTTEYINAKVNSVVNISSTLTFSSLLQKAADSVSALGKIARRIKKGFDYIGLSSVTFTYTANADLTNNYLGSDYLSNVSWSDFMAYQLGLNSNIITGDLNDRTAFGGMFRRLYYDNYIFYKDDNRSTTRTYQVSTGLRFVKPFDLSLTPISLQATNRYALRPDTTFFDNTWTFPDFRIGAQSSALNNLAIVKKYTQSMNVSSSFSIRRNKNSSSGAGTMTSTTYDMSPLLSVNGTVKKWPISFNYQHTVGQDKRESQGNATTTAHNGDNLDMSYEVQKTSGVSTIKLFKWAIPIRGRTSMGMRFSRDHQTTITSGTTTSDVSNLSLTPHLSYIFTDNVTGTLEYTGSRITDNGVITTNSTMSLTADIRF
jgi:Motility related/secretion protein